MATDIWMTDEDAYAAAKGSAWQGGLFCSLRFNEEYPDVATFVAKRQAEGRLTWRKPAPAWLPTPEEIAAAQSKE